MKDFSKKFDNVQGPDGGLTAEEFNNFISELENIAKMFGVSLSSDPTVVTQIAQAVFLAGMKSHAFFEGGSGNNFIINSVVGVNGPAFPNNNDLMLGALVSFWASHSNDGPATMSIEQGDGSLAFVRPLLHFDGSDLLPNDIVAGRLYTAMYVNSSPGPSWAIHTYDAEQDSRIDALEALVATMSSGYPVGAPVPWPGSVPPAGYLAMVGQAFNPATYPKLAQVYPSLVLPDLRGEFIRGWDNGRGVNPGRALLDLELDEVRSHNHPGTTVGALGAGTSLEEGRAYPDWSLSTVGLFGGPETRPRNIAFNFICKAE